MRQVSVLLSVLALLGAAGCGGDTSSAGGGLDESAEGGTNDTGSVGEQLSAEDVSEVEKLREQVTAQCNTGRAPRLGQTVDVAVAVARQNSKKSLVDLSNLDRAENLKQVLDDYAGLLDRCGAGTAADKLRAAEYRPT